MNETNLTYADYARLARMPLDELARDCDVQAFHATGPGGQGVNTADSAVRMMHRPTGITVVSRESRSQYRNRQLCLQKLRVIFEKRAVPPQVRHKTKVSRTQKRHRLADKRHRSELKGLRRNVDEEK